MNEQVFNYRSAWMMVAIVFMFVWSAGWLSGIRSSWLSETANINDREVPIEEARTYLAGMGAIGLAMLTAGICTLLWWLNARVVVTDDEILNYDWLGRERVRARRNSVRVRWEMPDEDGRVKGLVSTDAGTIRIHGGIRGYPLLRDILENPHLPLDHVGGVAQTSTPRYVPAARTYRYRWSYLHLFSFIWLAALGFIFSVPLGNPSMMENMSLSGQVESLVGGGAVVALGLWMQLTGWVERIRLDADGIEWIDWKGKSRVRASLAQITHMDEEGGEVGSLRIYTTQGTVRASSYLWGFSHLRQEVRQVLESKVR